MLIETGEVPQLLSGKVVQLDGSFPALKTCRFCGHHEGVLTGPKGPHTNGVRCNSCFRHIGWLPPSYDQDDDNFDVIED